MSEATKATLEWSAHLEECIIHQSWDTKNLCQWSTYKLLLCSQVESATGPF